MVLYTILYFSSVCELFIVISRGHGVPFKIGHLSGCRIPSQSKTSFPLPTSLNNHTPQSSGNGYKARVGVFNVWTIKGKKQPRDVILTSRMAISEMVVIRNVNVNVIRGSWKTHLLVNNVISIILQKRRHVVVQIVLYEVWCMPFFIAYSFLDCHYNCVNCCMI